MRSAPVVLSVIAACAIGALAMPTDTRARYEEADRQLGRLYKELVGQLKKENPDAVGPLRASERKWIEFRDLECKFHEKALASKGIAPAACLEELTLQRIETLRKVSETVDSDPK